MNLINLSKPDNTEWQIAWHKIFIFTTISDFSLSWNHPPSNCEYNPISEQAPFHIVSFSPHWWPILSNVYPLTPAASIMPLVFRIITPSPLVKSYATFASKFTLTHPSFGGHQACLLFWTCITFVYTFLPS